MEKTLKMPFNETQIYLLKMFETNRGTNELKRLKAAVSKFYFSEIEKEAKKVIKQKKLTQKQIDDFAAQHHRTSYK